MTYLTYSIIFPQGSETGSLPLSRKSYPRSSDYEAEVITTERVWKFQLKISCDTAESKEFYMIKLHQNSKSQNAYCYKIC